MTLFQLRWFTFFTCFLVLLPGGRAAENTVFSVTAVSMPEGKEAVPSEVPMPTSERATETESVDTTVSAANAAGVLSSPARVRVKVIPVRDVIGKPVLFVIRRGLKEAQEVGIQAVILDMETPGGDLGTTLKIMEALDRFQGETIVYVNKEAVSAGAIISAVADYVYFAPGGVIGAAEVVLGSGGDVPEGMKRKINSFLNAKIRAYNAGNNLRGEVIKAMMDPDYEFKIGEEIIKPKGELLSLTAEEAARVFGNPPRPLFSSGTFDSLEDLLTAKYGKNGYTLDRLEVTWSEKLAAWLSKISPLLMGAGMLLIFIEFKTPGFGIFGILGGLLLSVVFFGHTVAGLSGHEPALFFALGLALVALELFLFPGTLVAGILGVLLMLGSLLWSMVDVWPGEVPTFDAETFFRPAANLAAALAVALGGLAALARLLPRGWVWDRMILSASVAGDVVHTGSATAPVAGTAQAGELTSDDWPSVGAEGCAVSALRPVGEVEIKGRRYEAKTSIGGLDRGQRVRVVGRNGRTLIVEEVSR